MGFFDSVKNALSVAGQDIMSLVKVPLMSRRPSPVPGAKNAEMIILGNGPSLTSSVTQHPDFFAGKDLLAVNFFAVSELYTRLQPGYYLIADPLFWILDDHCERLFGAMAASTSWPMHLFMPAKAYANKRWQQILAGNDNITVHKYNTTPVEGSKTISHFLFRHGAGVPRPHNVLIPSIAQALRMDYRTIYLAGADHSWLPEISVTDDNEVLMNQKHFYDKGQSVAKGVKQENLNTARLHTILFHMYTAFKAYFILKDYAGSLGKKIINITPGSFIDAFDRQKL